MLTDEHRRLMFDAAMQDPRRARLHYRSILGRYQRVEVLVVLPYAPAVPILAGGVAEIAAAKRAIDAAWRDAKESAGRA